MMEVSLKYFSPLPYKSSVFLTLRTKAFEDSIGKEKMLVTSIPLFFLTLSLFLLMTTNEGIVDSVDEDQTAQNVQSDL